MSAKNVPGSPILHFLLERNFCHIWNTLQIIHIVGYYTDSFEELTHLKRPRCWERLKAGGEGDDRG